MNKEIEKQALSYEIIAKALFENYESIYDIDEETSAYRCYHESAMFRSLRLGSSGEDFFAALRASVSASVYPEDQEYVRRMLTREALVEGLKWNKYYFFVYRLVINKEPVYHQIRATRELVDGKGHILIGVKNVDKKIRQKKEHSEKIASMLQKEKNHMEAILAGAAGYLEINLSQDILLEMSEDFSGERGLPSAPYLGDPLLYSTFEWWWCTLLDLESAKKFRRFCGRERLLRGFEKGEKRASVSYLIPTEGGKTFPCRQVFYLYRDDASGDILCFSVVYDLTEQLKKEREFKELEQQLRMSRIRNFTSQMQPHFLYNALGSIQEIVLENPEYASELIGDFAIHLRSCIRAMSSDDEVPFRQELDNIRAYINIEKMRFGEKLRVVYEIRCDAFPIIPLSIQPLVENAIRHGIYERGVKGGTVTVRTMDREKAWIVQVQDDGVGFDYPQLMRERKAGRKDSTGLENLMFRLDKVMGARVDIYSRPGDGTLVTVTIPKEKNDDESDYC